MDGERAVSKRLVVLLVTGGGFFLAVLVLVAVMSIGPSVRDGAQASFFGILFDDISLDTDLSTFLAERPSATQLGLTDSRSERANFLYLPKLGEAKLGAKVMAYGRAFIGEQGCAAGVGLAFVAEALNGIFAEIASSVPSITDPVPLGGRHRVRYFSVDGFSGSVIWERACEETAKEQCELNISVTRDSCGRELAAEWQTVPR